MGFLSRLTGGRPAQIEDAERIYQAVMRQSRQKRFFGAGRIADNYDGRIDFLTLHIAIVFKALRAFPEGSQQKNAKLLSQAIFDVMKDDFDIALREEGLSDKGVSKRIKPIMQFFYGRLKQYDDAISQDQNGDALEAALTRGLLAESDESFIQEVIAYINNFDRALKGQSLAFIAQAKFAES